MSPSPEAGSFRDRESRVYVDNGKIYRGLSEFSASNWLRLSSSKFFADLISEGLVVETKTCDKALEGWALTLEHALVDTISYPYEWSFGMLRSAALFNLHILGRAVENGWTLKDASAFNIQWNGAQPVFVDVGSFEPYEDGTPWVAYRQFCMMFLYPLMLNAYLGVDFRSFLRNSLEGISPSIASKLLGKRCVFRPGVLTHVLMHAKLEKRAELADAREAKELTEESGKLVARVKNVRQSRHHLLATIDSMSRLVRKLELPENRTAWGNYDKEHSYSDGSFELKKGFVRRQCAKVGAKVVWDIGSNTGTFSRLAASNADRVLAIDGDGLAVDRLYRSLKAERNSTILPLVMDLTNPSPAQGWLGEERSTLLTRSKPDLVLCLALIHHLVLTANVPLEAVVKWLRSLGCECIFEFVDLDDPMSQMLVRQKAGRHHALSYDEFKTAIHGRFDVVASQQLKGGMRTLYHLKPS
ncbi:hypothetical protein [Shinella sumterensis]|uniref:hypothetical protein n=1 Tax=Shinella sumterensis TaxID=1967501 RepID=UPI003F876207